MTGLLQRLVNHALGTSAASGASPRVRSASAVHALAPIAQPAPSERVLPTLPSTPGVDSSGRGFATAGRDLMSAQATSQSGPPSPDTPAHARAPTQLQPHHVLPIDDTALTVSMANTNPRGDTQARKEVLGSTLPQRLLEDLAPKVAQSSLVPSRFNSDLSPRADRAQEAEQSTEVHVHIGRIEVTATHESPATKKTRAPTRPAVPLSQYLAQRRS